MKRQNALLTAGCFALLTLGTAVQAATEFPDGLVPAELVAELIGNPNAKFYTTLPDNYPLATLELGINLQLIGTAQPYPQSSRVLLRSEHSAAEVANVLAPALLDAGWKVVQTSGDHTNRTAELCHDEIGNLTLNARDAEDGSRLFATLFHVSAAPGQRECESEIGNRGSIIKLFEQMNAVFPVVELPGGQIVARGLNGVGGPPYHIELNREGIFEIENTSLLTLHGEIATQLEAAGWQEDTGSTGTSTASSVWIRTVEFDEPPLEDLEDAELVLFVAVISHGDDHYEVDMKMQTGAPAPLMVNPPANQPIIVPELGIRGISPGF